MSTILVIDAGPDAARRRFREEGLADWTGAATLALEKHGFLGFDRATADALPDGDALRRYGAIVVAPLPEAAWTEGLADALRASGRPLLLDGPLPNRALTLVPGVADTGPLAPEGSIQVDDTPVRQASMRYGFPASGRMGTGTSRPVDRRENLDWTQFEGVPITQAQAEAWRRPSWAPRRWSADSSVSVLARWFPAGSEEATPGVVRSGNVFACSFGLLAFLGQAHTSEPFTGPEYRNCERSTGFETLLLALLDQMHALAGVERARVLPWPRGVRWAMSVRHDFDRPLTPGQVAAVLAGHAQAGTSATWYWRARHLTGVRMALRRFRGNTNGLNELKSVGGPMEAFRPFRRSPGNEAIRLVASAGGHEVALHTDLLWAGTEDERQIIESVIGERIAGTCAHGDPDCFRFQGAPNVLWAETNGMSYTELIDHANFHPHRYATLRPDGSVDALAVLCLPHHESFDRSTTPGDVASEELLAAVDRWRDVGGMLQVMNHPDQNTSELFELLAELPAAGRIDLTAGEAADWWRRTHVRDNVELVRQGNDTWAISTRHEVSGMVVEFLYPDSTVRRRAVDVTAGETVLLSGALVAAS